MNTCSIGGSPTVTKGGGFLGWVISNSPGASGSSGDSGTSSGADGTSGSTSGASSTGGGASATASGLTSTMIGETAALWASGPVAAPMTTPKASRAMVAIAALRGSGV